MNEHLQRLYLVVLVACLFSFISVLMFLAQAFRLFPQQKTTEIVSDFQKISSEILFEDTVGDSTARTELFKDASARTSFSQNGSLLYSSNDSPVTIRLESLSLEVLATQEDGEQSFPVTTSPEGVRVTLCKNEGQSACALSLIQAETGQAIPLNLTQKGSRISITAEDYDISLYQGSYVTSPVRVAVAFL